MNARYQGPAVFPPAAQVRKRIEAHLDTLPGWEQKPNRGERTRKDEPAKPRKRRRRS
jgi:hypothetical protein